MNKKFAAILLSMMLVLTVVLSGCAKKQEPKEALSTTAKNAMQMKSYEMKSSVTIDDLQIKIADVEGDPSVNQALTMLKNAELTLTGVHGADPQQTEFQIGINLKGDMAVTVNLDMVMTKDKIYVKVPNIPTIPLPENLIGKYVVMDLKELAEQSGETFNPDALDMEKNQKFSAEVMDAVMAEYDQAKYFKQIDTKDANLPEGVDAKQVVQFYITNDTVKEAADILVNKVVPKVIDIIAKDEYRELAGVTKEEIEQAREEFKNLDQTEFKAGLDEMQKYLKVNTLTMNTAIDKKDFPSYQDFVLDVNFNDPESNESIKLALKGNTQYSKINEKPTFKIGIPKDTDVVTMDELQQMMGETTY